MRLVAVIPKEDLVELVNSLTPMRIVIDERSGRNVTLGRPKAIELVPERGLRIRGDARIMWDVAGVPIPVTLNEWQVLLVPRVKARGDTRVLALEPVVEQFDLKLVPGFIDDKIASVLRDGLLSQRDKLAWNFAKTLTKRLRLPLRMGPARFFELAAVDAGISITDAELRLAMRFEARVEHDAPAAKPERPRRESSRGQGVPSSRRPERRATTTHRAR